jgi:hypothetical protein
VLEQQGHNAPTLGPLGGGSAVLGGDGHRARAARAAARSRQE